MTTGPTPDELQRALARSDADKLCLQIDAFAKFFIRGDRDHWPEVYADDFGEINSSHWDEPEKALA